MMLPAPSTEPTPLASAVLTPVPPEPTPEPSSPLAAVLTPVPPDPTPEPLSPLAAVVELADAVEPVDAAGELPSSAAMPPMPLPAALGLVSPTGPGDPATPDPGSPAPRGPGVPAAAGTGPPAPNADAPTSAAPPPPPPPPPHDSRRATISDKKPLRSRMFVISCFPPDFEWRAARRSP